MPISHRSVMANFRCGVAPLKLETGRYLNQTVEERLCPICQTDIENEEHVIMKCATYESLRQVLFAKAHACDNKFESLSDSDKFIFLFSTDSIVHEVAKTCFLILKIRNSHLYR